MVIIVNYSRESFVHIFLSGYLFFEEDDLINGTTNHTPPGLWKRPITGYDFFQMWNFLNFLPALHRCLAKDIVLH